jgi:hypothetical protein
MRTRCGRAQAGQQIKWRAYTFVAPTAAWVRRGPTTVDRGELLDEGAGLRRLLFHAYAYVPGCQERRWWVDWLPLSAALLFIVTGRLFFSNVFHSMASRLQRWALSYGVVGFLVWGFEDPIGVTSVPLQPWLHWVDFIK